MFTCKNNFERNKRSTTQHSTTQLSPYKKQQGSKMLSKSKCTRRWENSKHTKYKHIFPSKSHKKLTLRAILLRNNSRKVNSKIARPKTGHSMLKGHKSKIDTETSPKCSTYKVKETPTILFLNCKEYDKK